MEDVEKLDEYLTKLFEARGYPGMAVCIRGPGGVLYEKGFGVRSLEPRQGVDADTIFGIASMSKSMAGLACCILQAEGRLRLDDPIVRYFPDFHIPGAADDCVTVRCLAMHRAGIPPMEPLEWSIAMNSVEPDSEWYREMRRTAPNRMNKIEQIIDYISAGNYEPLGAPGEYMSYCNEGYAILSYIVDQAAGMPLEDFLKERIFGPLGMTRTVLDLDGSEAKALAGGNITNLFERGPDGTFTCDGNWSVLPPFRACACVKSTARDMTKYYQMLSDGGVWEGRRLFPPEVTESMFGLEYPLRKRPFYCMGLRKRQFGGKMICDHSGGLRGVSSHGGFLEGGYSAAVLCNEGELDVEEFQWACYNHLLGLPLETRHDYAVPSGRRFSRPEMLCGDFVSREGIPKHCIVRLEDGELSADCHGKKVRLLYCEDSRFAAVGWDRPEERAATLRFYIRNGKAWGVKCGTRIHQRVAPGS